MPRKRTDATAARRDPPAAALRCNDHVSPGRPGLGAHGSHRTPSSPPRGPSPGRLLPPDDPAFCRFPPRVHDLGRATHRGGGIREGLRRTWQIRDPCEPRRPTTVPTGTTAAPRTTRNGADRLNAAAHWLPAIGCWRYGRGLGQRCELADERLRRPTPLGRAEIVLLLPPPGQHRRSHGARCVGRPSIVTKRARRERRHGRLKNGCTPRYLAASIRAHGCSARTPTRTAP